MLVCPLCSSTETFLRGADAAREYHQCGQCALVFVPSRYFLKAADERAVYDHHQNDVYDERYRDFLNRLVQPLSELLSPSSSGLDYGCGPGPALVAMMTEQGHQMESFDPFYARQASVLNRTYDFITATEVFEHFCRPAFEMSRLWKCLKSGGILGVMTKRVPDVATFSDWFYTRDPTHVAFFSEHTFRWIGTRWNAHVQFVGTDVVLLKKTSEARV